MKVPLKNPIADRFFNNPKLKIQLALAKGKNVRDKREKLREKEANRDIEKALRKKFK